MRGKDEWGTASEGKAAGTVAAIVVAFSRTFGVDDIDLFVHVLGQ